MTSDAEFDRELWFLAEPEGGSLAGAALCWTSAFLKDLVVHESWRGRADLAERPICSGAESFIAGTASTRIEVGDVEGLYVELAAAGVLHPVSRDGVDDTNFGTREFATLDQDGNLISFFRWES